MKTIREIRRENTRKLADRFQNRTRFAEYIERSPGQVNNVIGKNPIREIGHEFARHIESVFDKETGWLDIDHSEECDTLLAPTQNTPQRTKRLNLSGRVDAYEGGEELAPNEVAVPLIQEHNLTSGENKNDLSHLRFAIETLDKAGIKSENAACCYIEGKSMLPILPDGSIVAFDMSNVRLSEGELYAINYGGLLLVRYLHRMPFGGIKLTAANASQSDIELPDTNDVTILGKAFWYSAFI